MRGGKKRSGGGGGETSSTETVRPSWHLNDGEFDGNSDRTPHTGGDDERTETETAVGDLNRPRSEEDYGDNGSEAEEEEDREEGDKGFDRYQNLEIEDGDADTERPKLAEGFYEIEAVRRKRIRKGEVQYLIKWRGWPETANTWEPFKNLLSCSDVIDAFEESLSSGKHRSRRRKRKHAGLQLQVKKKQHRSPALSTTHNVTSARSRTVKEPLSFSYLNDLNHTSGVETNMGPADQENENGSEMGSQRIEERDEPNELDMKLSELKGTNLNYDDNAAKFTLQFQETGSRSRSSSWVGPGNGFSKVEGDELVQAGRCTGARRRKSGSVKRFKQDLSLNNDAQVGTRTSFGISGRQGQGIQNPNLVGSGMVCRNKNIYAITEIIRPISCSACEPHSVQDVSVTFMAMRSDGKEVMVDNKYLKANHPLLLINFYEKNLRYTTT